jgi:adenosylcobinamide-GDP ribazoletransferase
MFDASTRSALIDRAWRDLLDAWRYFSRLPAPFGGAATDAAAGAAPDMARFSWACPIAGALIGAVGAVAFGLAVLLGLPPLLRAAFAVATVILAAGAMHEGGLAGFADSIGDGQTRESSLALARGGRIGVYGALTLILSLIVRVAALAALARGGFLVAAASLILSGAVSRAGALIPLAPPPSAGADGAEASAGRLEAKDLIAAGFAVVGVALIAGLVALGVMQALFACVLAAAAAWGTSALARRWIGAQSGEVAGAAQQAAEVACLVALLIGGRAP